MTEIEKIDNRLNVIDAKMAALKEEYEHAANQRLHYEGRCETFRDTLNTLRNEYNKLEQEKKELCGTKQVELSLNRESYFQQASIAARSAIDDLDETRVITNADQLQTQNESNF